MKNKIGVLFTISLIMFPQLSIARTAVAPKKAINTEAPREITSAKEFKEIIKNGVVIADFYSPSCVHCKKMMPIFNKLADENNNVTFIKANVNRLNSLSNEYGVRSLPTFIFFKDGKKVTTVIGEKSPEALQAEINKLK